MASTAPASHHGPAPSLAMGPGGASRTARPIMSTARVSTVPSAAAPARAAARRRACPDVRSARRHPRAKASCDRLTGSPRW